MTQNIYPQMLYTRLVNPGTKDEYMLVGPDVANVTADVVGDSDTVDPTVVRYMLVGTGSVHYSAPRYVENSET